ncbi:MAG: transposase [Candidatus Caenarcaniphilales bacterium]|nr:transposase [Candidatus Caenarcaniphilales bacterium]
MPQENIIWADETGIEERMHRTYGRAERGNKVHSNISGKRIPRTTLISGYSEGVLKSPMVFKGYTDTKAFITWIEKCLLKEMEERHVLIIDNASFHKSPRVRELIESKGARLIYQPKYSPDLNKSEPQWANLKRSIRSDNSDIPFHKKLDKHILRMCT